MNLTRQYNSISEELNRAVLKVLSSGQYILGKQVSDFEIAFAEYVGCKYAVGVGNGTDALVIALRAIGVKEGDEVITCAMSFFATAEAIAAVGATPVFVDCRKDTYTIDPDEIEKKITSKTKAIVPVHLYGQCADMDEICEIGEKYGLKIIEDASQAAGAEYNGKKAGALGDIACFSLFPTKNLGCAGDGGIITTDDETLYKRCMAYRVHGSGENGIIAYQGETGEKLDADSAAIDFQSNLPKYYNFVIGYNSRLDAIQASILNCKLQYLEQWNERRREIARQYDTRLSKAEIMTPYVQSDRNKHVYYVYVITTKERDSFRTYLDGKNIATGVYFPIPLHLQTAFKHLGYLKGDMPNAEYLAEHSLAIPMFAELEFEEINYIVDSINNYKSN